MAVLLLLFGLCESCPLELLCAVLLGARLHQQLRVLLLWCRGYVVAVA
jgi:hypothetical protein